MNPSPPVSSAGAPPEQSPAPSFEQALQQLEGVVQRLEQGELALEESLELYEQGVRLSRLCHAKLEEAEAKVAVLLKDTRGEPRLDRQGRPRTAPLEPSDDDVPF
jgi:exodeoxyribonuclease VII small subunit